MFSCEADDTKTSTSATNEYIYSITTSIGSRFDQEDRYAVQVGLPGMGLVRWSYFAVFDGHGGSTVSEEASQTLLDHILAQDHMRRLANREVEENCEKVCEAIQEAFTSLEIKLHDLYLSDMKSGGSTCVCVLASPRNFYFVNCGDSRAFLCRDGAVRFETRDHKTSLPEERERIEREGGVIVDERIRGLAMSRAIGDFMLKDESKLGGEEDCIIACPDVTVIERNRSRDHFLFLASDGVYDVMTSDALSVFIRDEKTRTMEDVDLIGQQINVICRYRGSCDNITMILVKLVDSHRDFGDKATEEQEEEREGSSEGEDEEESEAEAPSDGKKEDRSSGEDDGEEERPRM